MLLGRTQLSGGQVYGRESGPNGSLHFDPVQSASCIDVINVPAWRLPFSRAMHDMSGARLALDKFKRDAFRPIADGLGLFRFAPGRAPLCTANALRARN